MTNEDHLLESQKTQLATLVYKGTSFFFGGTLIGILCHLLAVDLLFGPILTQIVSLPTIISERWMHLAGPGIVPFLMISGGLLIQSFAIFQFSRSLFVAITLSEKLSPKGLLLAKTLFLLLVFAGFVPFVSFSLRLAWQSIVFSQ